MSGGSDRNQPRCSSIVFESFTIARETSMRAAFGDGLPIAAAISR